MSYGGLHFFSFFFFYTNSLHQHEAEHVTEDAASVTHGVSRWWQQHAVGILDGVLLQASPVRKPVRG